MIEINLSVVIGFLCVVVVVCVSILVVYTDAIMIYINSINDKKIENLKVMAYVCLVIVTILITYLILRYSVKFGMSASSIFILK